MSAGSARRRAPAVRRRSADRHPRPRCWTSWSCRPRTSSEGEGFTAFSDLFQLYAAVDLPRLKDRPLPPQPVPALRERAPISGPRSARGTSSCTIPTTPSTRSRASCARRPSDPKVLAIKMTLYRVSPASPDRARALTRPSRTARRSPSSSELQARFDEEANIRWARALKKVGAHVVYGLRRLQDPLQGLPRGPPGRDGHPALLSPRHRQLQRPDGRRLRRPGALHVPRVVRRGPHRALQPPHRLYAPARLPSPAAGAHRPARRPASSASGARPTTPGPGGPARIIAKMNGLVDRAR